MFAKLTLARPSLCRLPGLASAKSARKATREVRGRRLRDCCGLRLPTKSTKRLLRRSPAPRGWHWTFSRQIWRRHGNAWLHHAKWQRPSMSSATASRGRTGSRSLRNLGNWELQPLGDTGRIRGPRLRYGLDEFARTALGAPRMVARSNLRSDVAATGNAKLEN